MSLTLNPNDVLRVITGQTCTLDTMVNYHDVLMSQYQLPVANQQFGQAIKFPGRTAWAITLATTTTICTGPLADPVNSAREIDGITITNTHATDPVDVTPIILSVAVPYRLGCGKVTLLAGQSLSWYPGTGWIIPAANAAFLLKVLAADDSLLGQNTVQPAFPTAGSVVVSANTTYLMDGHYIHSLGGATTRTTGLSFTGTATLTSIDYWTLTVSGAAVTIAPMSTAGAGAVMRVAVATNIVINATTTALETHIWLRGIVRTNAGGTFIPNFTWSADPTGASKVLKNSYFMLTQMSGDKTTVNWGTWA